MTGYVMNVQFNRLIYYLNHSEKQNHLFLCLGIQMAVHPQRVGFHLSYVHHGRPIEKILQNQFLGSDKFPNKDFLILKPITDNELFNLQKLFTEFCDIHVFILAHKLFDFSETILALKELGIPAQNFTILCKLRPNDGVVFSEHELGDCKKAFENIQKLAINLNQLTKINISQDKSSYLPFAFLTLLKVMLSPLNEGRVALTILFYPLLKIYWFCKFQYIKRIKNKIWKV